MPYVPHTLPNAETSYTHNGHAVALRPHPYRRMNKHLAELPDDGIVDPVAVERAAKGDRSVRLTPRELVCVVARLAFTGRSDTEIGAAFGYEGRGWAQGVRYSNNIPPARPEGRGGREKRARWDAAA